MGGWSAPECPCAVLHAPLAALRCCSSPCSAMPLALTPAPFADLAGRATPRTTTRRGRTTAARRTIPTSARATCPFTEQVNRAIDLGVTWLRARPQVFDIPDSDGLKGAHWGLIKGEKIYGGGEGPQYRHPAGPTALALYTLLKCGVSPKDPVIERGFDWLRSFHRITEEWDGFGAGGKTRHWTHTARRELLRALRDDPRAHGAATTRARRARARVAPAARAGSRSRTRATASGCSRW